MVKALSLTILIVCGLLSVGLLVERKMHLQIAERLS
jgi:hypothetical protein